MGTTTKPRSQQRIPEDETFKSEQALWYPGEEGENNIPVREKGKYRTLRVSHLLRSVRRIMRS